MSISVGAVSTTSKVGPVTSSTVAPEIPSLELTKAFQSGQKKIYEEKYKEAITIYKTALNKYFSRDNIKHSQQRIQLMLDYSYCHQRLKQFIEANVQLVRAEHLSIKATKRIDPRVTTALTTLKEEIKFFNTKSSHYTSPRLIR